MTPRGLFWLALLAGLASACGCETNVGSVPPPASGGGGGSGGTGGGGGAGGCDLDGDGHTATSCGGDDCNDGDPDVHPGAEESCDAIGDEDCDGQSDENCPCQAGSTRECYPPGETAPTRNVGMCRDGAQTCGPDRTWDDCAGAVVPVAEPAECDRLDQDCDGQSDEDLTNRCGACGQQPLEVCGNFLDDDCDGVIDNGDFCNVHCAGVDPESPQPAELSCCVYDPDGAGGLPPSPASHSFACVEWRTMAGCAVDRACEDLDGDPGTVCFRRCYDDNGDGATDRCVCGLSAGGTDPVQSPGCGFETPCARMDCDDREGQPCYSGPPHTLGHGICRSGTATCLLDRNTGVRAWSSCAGEVLPGVESCGDNVDNDCDGEVDEADGVTGQRCPGSGGCPPGATETCDNGLDDDCNGYPDDGCAPSTSTQSCWTGTTATRGIGACRDGVQTSQGEFWGACEGEQLPVPETCGDATDSDCDGSGGPGQPEDDGCCPAGAVELCDGQDNDCDGFVDEGTLNACGTCPGTPCYLEDFVDPANCGPGTNRTCNGIDPDPNNPDAFTLGQAQAQTPFIYIAVTGMNQVAKLDTVTGLKLWQVSSYGVAPSRTAVALDYSVWVGNRGFGCESDTSCSNLVHLDIDGNFICKADIPNIVRGVAIDGEGSIWAGSYNGMRVYKVHGSRTQPAQPDGSAWPDGLARCEIIDLAPADPGELAIALTINPYGLAIDGRGVLWTSSSPTAKIDTNSGTLIEYVRHIGWYGIAIDRNNDPWFGGWSAGAAVHRINGSGPYDESSPVDSLSHQTLTNATNVTAVTVAGTGHVWGSGYGDNSIWRVDPANPMGSVNFPIPAVGTNPHGIAEDGAGLIWAPLRYGGYAVRFDPVAGAWTTGPQGLQGIEVSAGSELYTYSDMTGSQLRLITTREGHWIQNFDSGYPSPDWFQVNWQQSVPAGTSVQAWVRSADTLSQLSGTPFVCGPYSNPPADLQGCPVIDGHRFAAVEMVLSSTQDGARPSVWNVQLSWARP